MTTIRQPDKAALRPDQRAKGDKIRVNFDSPAGLYGNRVRYCTPVRLPNGKVFVRAFRGIWTLKASLVPHREYHAGVGHGRLLKNAVGTAYRCHIRFDAQHVGWIGEDPRKLNTINQIQDAINHRDYQNR